MASNSKDGFRHARKGSFIRLHMQYEPFASICCDVPAPGQTGVRTGEACAERLPPADPVSGTAPSFISTAPLIPRLAGRPIYSKMAAGKRSVRL